MPSFLVLRPRPVQATRPIPAPRISLRRDPPAVAPPPEAPPTSPEPIDDRADLSPDEETGEPVLVVADDVPYVHVVLGDVEVIPRQQLNLFLVADPGQNVAEVQEMKDGI